MEEIIFSFTLSATKTHANFVATGGNKSCRHDNLQCHQ